MQLLFFDAICTMFISYYALEIKRSSSNFMFALLTKKSRICDLQYFKKNLLKTDDINIFLSNRH